MVEIFIPTATLSNSALWKYETSFYADFSLHVFFKEKKNVSFWFLSLPCVFYSKNMALRNNDGNNNTHCLIHVGGVFKKTKKTLQSQRYSL